MRSALGTFRPSSGCSGLTLRQGLLLGFLLAAFCVFQFAPHLQRMVRRGSGDDGPLVMKRTKTAGLLHDGPAGRKARFAEGHEEGALDEEDELEEGSDDDPSAADDDAVEEEPAAKAETRQRHEEQAAKKLRGKGGGKDEMKKETKPAAPAAAPALGPFDALPVPADKIVSPPREASWVPEQRPLEGEAGKKERGVTSPAFEAATQHSMNPPFWLNPSQADKASSHSLAKEWPAVLSGLPASLTFADRGNPIVESVISELSRRLVVSIVMGVHSGNTKVAEQGLISLPVFNTLFPTFLPTAQPHHTYRIVFAFDHNDPIYESAEQRGKIEAEAARLIAEENKKRWHPEGYKHGETVDGSTLLISLHWVHCDYSGKPGWAHSDAATASYKEGADYAVRMNDDTAFPGVKDWADRMISDLRGRQPVPNLGVVGPACPQGASYILTHDITHRTHAAIFGVHYPRSLPDWSSDDWVTYVYQNFGLMSRRDDAPVEHRMHGQRYKNQERAERLANLNAELQKGADTINDWVEERYQKRLPFTLKEITCC